MKRKDIKKLIFSQVEDLVPSVEECKTMTNWQLKALLEKIDFITVNKYCSKNMLELSFEEIPHTLYFETIFYFILCSEDRMVSTQDMEDHIIWNLNDPLIRSMLSDFKQRIFLQECDDICWVSAKRIIQACKNGSFDDFS